MPWLYQSFHECTVYAIEVHLNDFFIQLRAPCKGPTGESHLISRDSRREGSTR